MGLLYFSKFYFQLIEPCYLMLLIFSVYLTKLFFLFFFFFSRKKIGCAPTGILVHKAKATGFSSVSEMLQVMDPDNSVKNVKEMVAYPRKPATPSKV